MHVEATVSFEPMLNGRVLMGRVVIDNVSAVTQNQPLKVEIKGFKTSHCLE